MLKNNEDNCIRSDENIRTEIAHSELKIFTESGDVYGTNKVLIWDETFRNWRKNPARSPSKITLKGCYVHFTI